MLKRIVSILLTIIFCFATIEGPKDVMASSKEPSYSKKCGNTMDNLWNGGIATEYKGYIYYGIYDGSDKCGIYKISAYSKDSKNAVKISDNSFKVGFNALDNYEVSLNGLDETLNPTKPSPLQVTKGAYETCRIKIDGSGFENLTN